MDFGLGFMFDAGPYGFSVLIAGARLGVRFELHLITQWGPPKRDPWKPHISPSFRWAHQKGSPNRAPPEAPRRSPDQSKIATLTRLALFAAPGQPRSGGPFRGPFFFTLKRHAGKLGSQEAPFWGFPFGAI